MDLENVENEFWKVGNIHVDGLSCESVEGENRCDFRDGCPKNALQERDGRGHE